MGSFGKNEEASSHICFRTDCIKNARDEALGSFGNFLHLTASPGKDDNEAKGVMTGWVRLVKTCSGGL